MSAAEPAKAKWIDLARFGVTLSIVPRSPLRGTALTVLEIRDAALLEQSIGLDRSLPDDAYAARKEAFFSALQDLGFDSPATIHFDADLERNVRRYMSTRTKYSIEDLRPLLPPIEASDLREMPIDAIVLQYRPEPEIAAQWKALIDTTLATDALDVWTPRISPYERSFDNSESIKALHRDAQLGHATHLLFGRIDIGPYRLLDVLERAQYRSNALVGYYADLASALSDGWKEEELVRTDLPHALPLWITPKGRVVGLKDVRFAPEIMDVEPATGYGRYEADQGLVIRPLREVTHGGLAAPLAAEYARWLQWSNEPQSLTDARQVEASLAAVLASAVALKERAPRVIAHYTDFAERRPVPDGSGDTHYAVTPLAELGGHSMRGLAAVFVQFGVSGLSEKDLAEGFGKVLQAARKRLEEQAREEAQEQLAAVSQAVRSAAAAPESGAKVKHVDAGEKIGGARKDFKRHALRVEDLDAMNDRERKGLVVKNNVWPSLDYVAMREAGVTPQAAMAIKALKDSINVAPDIRRQHPDSEARYIETLGFVRDRMETVETLDHFRDAMVELYEYITTIPGKEPGSDFREKNSIYGHTLRQICLGEKTSTMIWEGGHIPGAGCVPRKIAYQLRHKVGEDPENWSALIKKGTRKKSDEQLDAERSKVEVERDLHRPHLACVTRSGEDWRHGRDIVAEDLIDHFGFRAVEFGEWLPNDERQEVLNHAFDAFADLAQALDIPPLALSFDGELAVAFGSRGHGGKNAALAHYEPDRVVINLTRLRGAGTLAHEWVHGLDWHLGGGKSLVESAQRGTPMGAVFLAMHKRPADPADLFETAKANAQRGRENAVSWLYSQPKDNRELLKEIIESQFGQIQERWQALADEAYVLHRDHGRRADTGLVDLHESAAALEGLMERLKKACESRPALTKVRDKVEANLRYALHHLTVLCTVEAAKRADGPLPAAFLAERHAVDTSFVDEARKLDRLRAGAYWATPRELLARAGAAYVFDRLSERGVRSDYLVFGSEADRHSGHAVGNPNPTGAEREAIGAKFAAVIDAYRLQHLARQERKQAQLIAL
ncbi:MAG: hypothetical protein EPN79_15680 [Burkholderiaceae bacterium]|nr:MAG: hypothetical protein EPN79_15680 [Burkholderiaceae bacterium]